MKYVICAVRDSALDAYGVPMFLVSKGQAIRGFSDQVNNPEPNNNLNKHPEDYELFFLGTFDDAQCDFETVLKPESLIRATDCKTPKV